MMKLAPLGAFGGMAFTIGKYGISTLVPLAKSQLENPTAFIENTALFGDLAQQPRFVEAYLWALESLHENGSRATLEQLMKTS